jgi:AraC-like DNA-binding protein
MMYEEKYSMGLFGLLDMDGLDRCPAKLIDGGIETRYKEEYHFDNRDRVGYGGYLIQYTLKGEGIYEKDGICHKIKEGMGMVIQFPEDSSYYLSEGDEPWTFLYLHFDGDALVPYIKRLKELTQGVFSLGVSAKSIRMFLQLHERICNGERLKKYESNEFIFSFLCTLLRDIETEEKENKNVLVKKAVDLMDREFKSLEGVQSVASRLGITQEHLGRLFKAEMNVSPGQYLIKLRIQYAMQELLNTDDSLEKIAGKCGFSNANYLGKVFKKHVGTTPIQYRNMK